MFWIIENNSSMDWELKPNLVYVCSREYHLEDKARIDKYAREYAGVTPAAYGYVRIEGEHAVDPDPDANRITFSCESKEEMDFVYERIADALLHHPEVIDLRGKFIRII